MQKKTKIPASWSFELNKFAAIILFGLVLGAALICSQVATAETDSVATFEGIVELRGSSINKKTYLKTKDNSSSALCKNALSKKIGQIAGMEVELKGQINHKNKKRQCIAATSLRVLKTGSGNAVLTGRLVQNGPSLGVKVNQSVVTLAEPIPAGLGEKIGKEIMLVLPQKTDFNLSNESITAVSFLEFINTSTKE